MNTLILNVIDEVVVRLSTDTSQRNENEVINDNAFGHLDLNYPDLPNRM